MGGCSVKAHVVASDLGVAAGNHATGRRNDAARARHGATGSGILTGSATDSGHNTPRRGFGGGCRGRLDITARGAAKFAQGCQADD